MNICQVQANIEESLMVTKEERKGLKEVEAVATIPCGISFSTFLKWHFLKFS